VLESISGIAPADWNRLAGDDPFLRHEFLCALHDTGCAATASGWSPQFVTLWQRGELQGALPLYLKTHSYGEYVFDWAWADAYQRHGLRYYPKLLSAIPFTPVSGRRLLAASAEQRALLLRAALEIARELGLSSLHVLFPTTDECDEMRAHGMLLRHGVQFHWENPGYAGFEDFLAGLSHAKRKNIRQERRKVAERGISFAWLSGGEARESDWAFFVRCYRDTYRQHHSSPYLNLEFFTRIARTMPDNLVLIVASRAGKPVAASFNVRNAHALYGRYWGSIEYHPVLHFEACYYQTIEYCIAHGLKRFEGGAQGAHKIARGLLPVATHSLHWLAHPEFSAAIEQYLARERRDMHLHIDELNEHSPFRRDADAQPGDDRPG